MALRHKAGMSQRLLLAVVLLWLTCWQALAMPYAISRIPGHPKLRIGWNPNLETVFLLVLLGRSELPAHAPPLQRQAWQDFAAFRQSSLAEWANGMFWAMPHILVHLPLSYSPLPEGKPQARPLAKLDESELNTEKFWTEVKNFYLKAKVGPWLARHRPVYQQALAETLAALPAQDLLALQEAYHRRSFSQYEILISQFEPFPLFSWAPPAEQALLSFSVTLRFSENTKVAYELIGPVKDNQGHWTFADRENLIYLMMREFGHAFCDTLVNDNLLAPLQRPERQLQREHYLRELLVRAVHARLVLQLYGPEAYEHHLQSEARQGYFAVRRLADQLSDYEQDPQAYPTFSDFYPHLLPMILPSEVMVLPNSNLW